MRKRKAKILSLLLIFSMFEEKENIPSLKIFSKPRKG